MKTKRIICLYGGPGTGKSTCCAGLYYKLKILGYECEMNREYIKDWIWEGRNIHDGDQTYFFAKQARLERIYMERDLDFIITDSPLILTHFYGLKNDRFEQEYNTSSNMLKNHHGFCVSNNYKTDHFFLERPKPYSPAGRFESEQEALNCDSEIKYMLDDFGINYIDVLSDQHCVDTIIESLEGISTEYENSIKR